jgi:citrate lyase subunit beta/citryl-CoA lyase
MYPDSIVEAGTGMTLLRSLLFVPGDRPDQMAKALKSGADVLILDLEDAVRHDRKSEARASVAAFLRESDRSIALLVRINPLGSGLTDDDLAVVLPARPDAIVLPKAEGAETVRRLLARMAAQGPSCQ